LSKLVGQGHENHATDARLDVFLGLVERQVLEFVGECLQEAVEHALDGLHFISHLEVVGQGFGVFQADVGGEFGGHHHRLHPLGADGVHRHHQG